jgi:hypothetical protein
VNTSTLVQKLWSYCLGEPQVHKNLTVYPLLHDGAGEPDYLLLDEAVQRASRARSTAAQDHRCAGRVRDLGVVQTYRIVHYIDQRVSSFSGPNPLSRAKWCSRTAHRPMPR